MTVNNNSNSKPRKQAASTRKTTSSPDTNKSIQVFKPNVYDGRELGVGVPLLQVRRDQLTAYFEKAKLRNQAKMVYDRDWGALTVDQGLPSDPGPINAVTFKPVKRWIVLYRTDEGGIDGTHNITVSNVRTAIAGAGTFNADPFIIKSMHIWIAPNSVNTHFSANLYTKDDADNGILGGVYSDVAPYGEFVRFRVMFHGEGYVSPSSDSVSKVVIGLGGSAKWNGLVYAEVETFD